MVYDYELNDNSKTCDLCGQNVPKTKRITGMVIGDNIFLTPANIKNIRFVPEMVFINCCHLGKEEGKQPLENPHKLAANLATEFIRMGVKVVIAAGWAVNDRAAETFANSFYGLMLEGRRFGDAVRRARKATYLQHPGTNTWGAYQCYGNPDFQLKLDNRSGSQSRKDEAVSETELASKIDNIGSEAKTSGADIHALLEILNVLVDRIPESWKNKDVHESLGRTYGELGALSKAIEHYTASLKDKKSDASLKTIEQLANLQAKWAVTLWQQEDERKTALAQINKAITMMEDLLKFGETGERLSILASAYKRKAWITTGNARIAALRNMEEYYKKASETAPGDTYPRFNYLTATMIVAWRKNKGRTEKTLREKVLALASTVTGNEKQTDFWKLVEYADYQLIKNLALGEIAANTSEIIRYYCIAKKRAGSPKEFGSVTDHIEFLALMAQSQITDRKIKNETVNSLKKILTALTSNSKR